MQSRRWEACCEAEKRQTMAAPRAQLFTSCQQIFDPEFRKPFPSVERYFTTLAAQPQFAKVVGDWSLPTTAPQGVPPAIPCVNRAWHLIA